jgi:hypothetical protein
MCSDMILFLQDTFNFCKLPYKYNSTFQQQVPNTILEDGFYGSLFQSKNCKNCIGLGWHQFSFTKEPLNRQSQEKDKFVWRSIKFYHVLPYFQQFFQQITKKFILSRKKKYAGIITYCKCNNVLTYLTVQCTMYICRHAILAYEC